MLNTNSKGERAVHFQSSDTVTATRIIYFSATIDKCSTKPCSKLIVAKKKN